MDQTLTIIKPYAVEHGYIGPILARINEAGFRIVSMKFLHLTRKLAGEFYEMHKEKVFYERLIDFMTSGPIVVAILEKPNAVEEFRTLIGTTDPYDADEGTIRKMFGTNIEANAVHGSDSNESAIRESNFFFSMSERF